MRRTSAPRSLLVTTSWDDGHPSDLRVADLLDKHGLTGTFYVPCVNSEARPVMPSHDIARIGQRFEIGGHTRNHVVLTELAPAVAAREISSNKARLEDLLGRQITSFAYVRGRHNRLLHRLVAEAGYRYARTTTNLLDRPGSHRLRMPTTAQFYPHSPVILLRNYLRFGPTWPRAAVLTRLLRSRNLPDGLMAAARWCAISGGAFHLWGHSWELDEHELWTSLDQFLGLLRRLSCQPRTNSDWCSEGVADHAHRQQTPGSGSGASVP
ncbi:MAG: polysaccharide deacetylase family protein [Bradyrhizobium sp.]